MSLLASGRVAGDRVLGVRFADTPEPDDAWSSKRGMLVLMNTPGLARVHISYRHESQRLALGFQTAQWWKQDWTTRAAGSSQTR